MGTPAADLKARIKLERDLSRKLRVLDQEIVEQFTQGLIRTGTVINVESRALGPLTNILQSSYFDAGRVFDSQIRKTLAADIAITATEEVTISAALSDHYVARAPIQSRLILTTHQKNMFDAVLLAEEEAVLLEITSPIDKARLAGRILDRKLVGREGGIATLETLAPSEAAKLTEFQVLSGASTQDLSILGGTPNIEPKKTWETQGDEEVRGAKTTDQFSHILADEQTVPGGEPFLVGNQELDYPGDTSRGASVANVAQCRCGTRYSTKEVADVRRRRMAA